MGMYSMWHGSFTSCPSSSAQHSLLFFLTLCRVHHLPSLHNIPPDLIITLENLGLHRAGGIACKQGARYIVLIEWLGMEQASKKEARGYSSSVSLFLSLRFAHKLSAAACSVTSSLELRRHPRLLCDWPGGGQ